MKNMFDGKIVKHIKALREGGEVIEIEILFADGTSFHVDTAGGSTDLYISEDGACNRIEPDNLNN